MNFGPSSPPFSKYRRKIRVHVKNFGEYQYILSNKYNLQCMGPILTKNGFLKKITSRWQHQSNLQILNTGDILRDNFMIWPGLDWPGQDERTNPYDLYHSTSECFENSSVSAVSRCNFCSIPATSCGLFCPIYLNHTISKVLWFFSTIII